MLSSEEPLLLSTNSRRMFFKISSSETRRPKNFLAFITAQMFRLPTFLLLRRCSDLPGELEIKSWSERSSAPTNFQGMNQKSNQLLSEQEHPGFVFLKARSELDLLLLLLLSVSAAPSASGTDEGAGKCIEIFAISLTV
jgi:hypothetical protein